MKFGDIVTYKDGNETNGMFFHPAIVTHVFSDECVNLHVFLDANLSKPLTSVKVVDAISENDVFVCCSSMSNPEN